MNTQNFNPDYHPKVFISYSWDSPEHIDYILTLANRLRQEGVDCEIDQYYHQTQLREGWYDWMMNQIEEANFVLMVCTENYYLRYRKKVKDDVGRGVKWEEAIITQDLYKNGMSNDKYIPVLTASGKVGYIPPPLRSSNYYELDRQYEDLYRHLTNQPSTTKPPLGTLRPLEPRKRTRDFIAETQDHLEIPCQSSQKRKSLDLISLNKQLYNLIDKLKTPLTLSGIVVIVLFVIYKQILSLDVFENIGGAHTFDILQYILEKLFWLALVSIILGVASYLITFGKKISDVRLIDAHLIDRNSNKRS